MVAPTRAGLTGADAMPSSNAKHVFTDSHFLIPLAVFCIGLALLITLH